MDDELMNFEKFAGDCGDFFKGNLIKDFKERTAPGKEFIGVRYVLEFGDIYVKTFFFRIEPDGREGDMLRVMICGVFPDESGRMMTNFLFKGTMDEVVEYLLSDKAPKEFIDSARSLNDKIRKHD